MRLYGQIPALIATLSISLFAITTSAQNANLPNLSSNGDSRSQVQPTNSGNRGSTAQNTGSPSEATPRTTPTTRDNSQSSSVLITGSGSRAQTSGSIPVITGGSSVVGGGALTGNLPTIAGAFIIVPPSVPPTANAPFMQTSNLPEGTVFIVVGAILGFLALGVMAWRGLVAWSLHRSVKRAAMVQNMSDAKTHFRKPPAPFYKYSDRDSTLSLSAGRGGKKSGRPTTAPGGASASSLFFSPTAGAAGAALSTAGNRGSNYLPSGYYAAGAAQPGNGQGMAHIGSGNGHSISLSNLPPQGHSYPRPMSMGPSPPDSPGYNGSGHVPVASSSTLNLTQGYGGEQRAPSAYLEDLFDGEGAPPLPRHATGAPR